MPEPKYVIAMGACTITGWMFSTDSYSTVRGVDKLTPVDFYLPGCPPKPEAVIGAITKLHKKISREIYEDRERLLFLGQEVDSEISNQLIGLMVYLSIENDTKDLYLFINSPGGWVIPGVAIYDTMQFVQPDVHTICMRLAASIYRYRI
ncbi:hypothetical protein CXB51_001717 [Gossypium anomalum]|uniref:ATP-dependent Clp protease proteolytic subunit n=1 Tax=Gossypium anomalum TaxID=47600 RepID=A0A8J5ZLF0_9ROSI|nr:hypothetical protein CXB51_001717 [Gossypium anomalum]